MCKNKVITLQKVIHHTNYLFETCLDHCICRSKTYTLKTATDSTAFENKNKKNTDKAHCPNKRTTIEKKKANEQMNQFRFQRKLILQIMDRF